MDQRLTVADPDLVRRFIATTYLAAPVVPATLGEILLEPHQLDAAGQILELLRLEGGAVLADATGMGKTFVALAVARALGRTVVVAPAALRDMWKEALRRTPVYARVESYESLSRVTPAMDERPDLIILDEAHHARNPASQRYARLADLAWGSRVLILSATPVHNRGRDVRALLALFIGSRAHDLSDEDVRRYIVRRTSESLTSKAMPSIERPVWLDVPRDPQTLCAIEAIPPAVPASDGSPAHALMILGLIRAWASSEAALCATLRRRLQRVSSYFAALDAGRRPARHELASWPMVDDAVQLGFPDMFAGETATIDQTTLREALVRHQAGVRAVLRLLDGADGMIDCVRADHLASIMERRSVPVVAFSQFADTARSIFSATARRGGVALVTGQGARVSSGPISTDEVVRGFDIGATHRAAMPLDLLVATDVLSEGLSLRRAGVIVHLDVPWTLARLEQRVGRLRRLGSPHRSIHVYAIGPPLESGELSRVLRALQRKARLTSSVVGLGDINASIPLLGDRLARATAQLAQRREAGAAEQVRTLLGEWLTGENGRSSPPAHVALVLMRRGDVCKLLAIGPKVSDRMADIGAAIAALGGPAAVERAVVSERLLERVDAWTEEQRAHDLVRPALDAPSSAHIGVLQELQKLVQSTHRAERTRVAERVEACRALVVSARGVGAELAMQRLLHDGVELDALEELLHRRRAVTNASDASWRVVAAIESDANQPGVIAVIDGSMHPDLRRSSTDRPGHVAARG